MNNDNKAFIGLAIGLFAGAVAGYYLASDDGKKMRKKAAKKAKKLEEQAKTALKEQAEVLTTKFNEVATNAQNYVNEATETAKTKYATYKNQAEDVMEDTESSFQKGINSAKAKIATKADKVATAAEK